jgi:hypothetical protein
VLETPKELTDIIVEGVRDVFFDCLINLYAIPSVVETERFGGSVAKIREEVESLWNRAVLKSLMGGTPNDINGKMYLIAAWIDKRHRNKGKGKHKKKEKEHVPWLNRLALEGTVASGRPSVVPSVVAATSTAAAAAQNPELVDPYQLADALETADMVISNTPRQSSTAVIETTGKSESENNEDRAYTAFAVMEWDRSRGSLFIMYMAPRSVFLPTLESYGELLRRGVERVQADVRRDNAPPLEHVWCWTRGGGHEHARLQAIPERLGFVPVEQYVRNHPEVDRATFRRSGYEPLSEEGVEIHVTTVKDFLKLTGVKPKK